ncbi:MAG TPA: hypothetical protein PLH19_13040 [Anaerolineae bacterium]|nr:hypothetical protein [Anaerolineae bacterium]HQH39443.1 hypothetical protein [Anaerolineae bacterium]
MNPCKTPFHPCRRWLSPVLFVSFALLYVAFRSISLDDFDSYSFALALDNFNLELQQPQPPGFPVYVFLGRLLYRITGNATTALTLLSALCGAGVVALVCALGQTVDRDRPPTRLWAALLVGLTPMGWLTAEKALSDTPGLLWTLLSVWLLWRSIPAGDNSGAPGKSRLRWAALVLGLMLGVRPQNALPSVLLGGFVVAKHLALKRSPRDLVLACGCGLVGVALWLIPTADVVGGLPAYVAQIQAHAAHVGRADALWGMGLPPAAALRARALAFADTWLTSTLGVGTFAPWGWREKATVGVTAVACVVALARAEWRRRDVQFLAMWTVVAAGQVFLFENLDRPRLMLPILPPLALLIAHGWARSTDLMKDHSAVSGTKRRSAMWKSPLRMGITAILTAALLAQGVPLAAQLATIPAPPAQATAYVAAHYPAEKTLVAAAGSFRAVQVELPDYRLAYLYRFDAETVARTLAGGIRYVVIFDRDQFPADALAVLSSDGRYVPLEDRTFVRSRRVHTQHDQVRVQVLTPANLVPPEALALPPDGCLDIGGEADGRYLAQGWFRPEDIGGASGRWAGETLTSTVRLTPAPATAYRLQFRALAYPAGQTVTLDVGEREIGRLSLAQGWSEYEVTLPADMIPAGEIITLALIHAVAQSPFDATGGDSSDTRPLTAAYDWICFLQLP